MAKKHPKRKKTSLNSPCLRTTFDDCLSCGYPLEGIPIPGNCPECGLRITPGRTTLCISGVAKGTPGPIWRKIAWISIGTFGFIYSQTWAIAMLNGFGWYAILGFAALIISLAAMVVTSKQKKRGSEVFAFTDAGFSRWTTGTNAAARYFTPWPGIKQAANIKRVSPVWASLKVTAVDQSGKHTTPIETGFRCPVEDIPIIQSILDAFFSNQPLDTIESLKDSNFYAINPADPDPHPDPAPPDQA